MDIASSALSNSLKVGLQIATNYKRPFLEVFFELRNDFGPETTSELPLRNEDQPRMFSRPCTIVASAPCTGISNAHAFIFSLEDEICFTE